MSATKRRPRDVRGGGGGGGPGGIEHRQSKQVGEQFNNSLHLLLA